MHIHHGCGSLDRSQPQNSTVTATAVVTPELSHWCASVPVLSSQPALELPPPPRACLALRASLHESALWSLHKSLLPKCNNGCRCALESRVDTQQPRSPHDTLIRQPPHHHHRFSSASALHQAYCKPLASSPIDDPLLPNRQANVPRETQIPNRSSTCISTLDTRRGRHLLPPHLKQIPQDQTIPEKAWELRPGLRRSHPGQDLQALLEAENSSSRGRVLNPSRSWIPSSRCVARVSTFWSPYELTRSRICFSRLPY